MNAPAIVSSLQAIGDELQSLCDRLDDAECARNFLRDFFASLPIEVATWHCYAEDRIVLDPAYRALSDDARRAVQWGICPVGKLTCRAGMAIGMEHLQAAAEFLRVCRDSVAEMDDVWECAENARTELLAKIKARELDELMCAEWRAKQYDNGREAFSQGMWWE